ncbi:hypothetical protein HYO33_23180 [Vibrio parahaemolyticus]|nr:hypothetical protein [Vibrio parahaemolyticus]ELA9889998.1 hypothetical protein [Vibrio parahaemolyticus]MBM4950823.1 hypothetical protein [Vibrio parahaemolyticus]
MATKKDVEAERNRQKIAEIKRKGNISAIRSYIISGCCIVAGIPMVAIGGIEFVEPAFLDLVTNGAEVFGYGSALLGGPGAVKVIGNVVNSVNEN